MKIPTSYYKMNVTPYQLTTNSTTFYIHIYLYIIYESKSKWATDIAGIQKYFITGQPGKRDRYLIIKCI